MNLFEDLGLSEDLLKTIKKLGFDKPTQIQTKSIPSIMHGMDVIGESATGSGKTLAFGCGIIDNVEPGKGIQALVLTPTRELAEQVMQELKRLSAHKKMKLLSIYGGVAINPQIDKLQRADVVVATPGRLLDHLQRRTINLSKVKFLVMDEADRMFDMGFIDDVEKIISQCPKQRQTLFFSATISSRVTKLANKHLKKPIQVFARKHVDPAKLKQVYYNVQKNVKLSLLIYLLKNEPADLVMVFCNSRRTVDFVVKNLRANKVDAIALHGGLSQNRRTATIESFHKGKGILVCTDVAARGLHIDNVSHIYNYEVPSDPTDYVHRIGRTARAGEEGKVINLISEFDHDNFSRIWSEHRNFSIVKLDTPKVERILSVKAPTDRQLTRGRFGGRGQGRSQSRGHSRSGSSYGRSRDGSSFGRSSSSRTFHGRSSQGVSSYGGSSYGGSSYGRGASHGRSGRVSSQGRSPHRRGSSQGRSSHGRRGSAPSGFGRKKQTRISVRG